MTNHLISIESEADSLEEARKRIRSRITEGSFLLFEEVVTYGGTQTAKASAKTTEEFEQLCEALSGTRAY